MKPIKTWVLAILTFLTWQHASAQEQLSQAGYYRANFGSFQIVALSDGTVPVEAKTILLPKDPGVLAQQLKKAGLASTVEISINAYLIKSGSRLILVDAGSGDLFKPFGGRLVTSIMTAGYRPEDISDILITHVHVDHSGGLSQDGKLVFPNATIHLSQKELDFWKVHETLQTGEAKGITLNRPAYLNLKPYLTANRIKAFSSASEIIPGIAAIEKPGHTPGHTVYAIGSGKQKMIFFGDLVHIEQVQFYDSSIPDEYDFDKQKGATQRNATYAEFARKGYIIAAAHVSFPGIGRIIAEGNHYKWLPVPYSVLGKIE
ncbi:MAG: MBL fold metallo-hydrolase [Mucilaginibacter sp.]|uniref:MBL fold metallo-hydrolase n=1 Tax=Mucilaginibacter sp. TaxID=1882438 RepID=UPI003265CB7D